MAVAAYMIGIVTIIAGIAKIFTALFYLLTGAKKATVRFKEFIPDTKADHYILVFEAEENGSQREVCLNKPVHASKLPGYTHWQEVTVLMKAGSKNVVGTGSLKSGITLISAGILAILIGTAIMVVPVLLS